MGIFDKAIATDTRRFMRDTIKPVQMECDLRDTGGRRPSIDRHKEWELRLVVTQNYWANDVQEPHFRKTAMRAIAAYLYQDVSPLLHRMEICIESGDRHGAHEVLGQMRQAMDP